MWGRVLHTRSCSFVKFQALVVTIECFKCDELSSPLCQMQLNLVFLITKWKWKWLKLKWGLRPPTPTPLRHGPRSKKPCASVNKVGPRRKVGRALALLLLLQHNTFILRRKHERIVDNDGSYIEGCRHNCWLLTCLVLNTQSALPALLARILSTFLGLCYLPRHKVFLTWACDPGGFGGQSPPIVGGAWGTGAPRKFQPLSLSFGGQKHQNSVASGTGGYSTHHTLLSQWVLETWQNCKILCVTLSLTHANLKFNLTMITLSIGHWYVPGDIIYHKHCTVLQFNI